MEQVQTLSHTDTAIAAAAGMPLRGHVAPTLISERLEDLFDRLRLAVIYGNAKTAPGAVIYQTANLRHWKSYDKVAEEVADALRTIGFRHVMTMPDGMDLPERLRCAGIHMAWGNTAGVQGRSPVSHTPAMLEMVGIPFVGHDPVNSGLLDDKGLFKLAMAGLGLPTPRFLIWNGVEGWLHPAREPRFAEVFGDYAGPFVVKPVNGRASQNVLFVDGLDGVEEAVATVYDQTGCLVLIEIFLPGREYCIAVCGGTLVRGGRISRTGRPFPFSPVERVLEPEEWIFTSMDKLAITRDRVRPLAPIAEQPVIDQLNDLARRVYEGFNLETLIRLDVRADAQGRLNILEANPKPDLARPNDSRISIVCVGLPAIDMTYEDLILSLLVDRLEHLHRYRPYAIQHILDLL